MDQPSNGDTYLPPILAPRRSSLPALPDSLHSSLLSTPREDWRQSMPQYIEQASYHRAPPRPLDLEANFSNRYLLPPVDASTISTDTLASTLRSDVRGSRTDSRLFVGYSERSSRPPSMSYNELYMPALLAKSTDRQPNALGSTSRSNDANSLGETFSPRRRRSDEIAARACVSYPLNAKRQQKGSDLTQIHCKAAKKRCVGRVDGARCRRWCVFDYRL